MKGGTLTFDLTEGLLPCPCCGRRPKARICVKENPILLRYVARFSIACPCFLYLDVTSAYESIKEGNEGCFDAAQKIIEEGKRRWNRRTANEHDLDR